MERLWGTNLGVPVGGTLSETAKALRGRQVDLGSRVTGHTCDCTSREHPLGFYPKRISRSGGLETCGKDPLRKPVQSRVSPVINNGPPKTSFGKSSNLNLQMSKVLQGVCWSPQGLKSYHTNNCPQNHGTDSVSLIKN